MHFKISINCYGYEDGIGYVKENFKSMKSNVAFQQMKEMEVQINQAVLCIHQIIVVKKEIVEITNLLDDSNINE
jgi:hypothetical protein